MSYILMTKMQYLELTHIIPSMRCSFNDDFRKNFEKNHPMACENIQKEENRKNKIYEKFRFGNIPKLPLSGSELDKAIQVCSEKPSQCFYLEEALSQVGYHNLYSYEGRFSALTQALNMGSVVLVEEGTSGAGGAPVKAKESFIQRTGQQTLGLIEAAGGLIQNTGAFIQSRVEGVVHGVLQATKGDIRDAFDTMNATKNHRYEKYSHKLSENAQKTVDNDFLIQKSSNVLNSTVGAAFNTVNKVAKDNLSEDAYFYVASTLDPALALWPGAAGALKNVRVGSNIVRPPMFSKGMGIEKASQELIDSISKKRSITWAENGSDALRYLESRGAEAVSFGVEDIILRPNPSKAAILEEFLHGTQNKLGIPERLGYSGMGSAETHVKNFMIRHGGMLGISNEDIQLLIKLRDAGL